MYSKNTLEAFTEALSTKAAVPGGGGASSLVGAIGVALCSMVCNLTSGKKSFVAYEEDYKRIINRAEQLRLRHLELIDADAEAFEPLSKAYSLPSATDEEKAEKERVMAIALDEASKVPLEIMKTACEAIELHHELVSKCSKIAISDVGVGVTLLRGALLGASLNVYINTRLMTNKELAAEYNKQADDMIARYTKMADEVFNSVAGGLR